MIEAKKLRECLGLFTTGVIIACARKKNFFADNLFAEKFLDKKIFTDTVLANSFLAEKLKKIFSEEFFGMTINSFTSVSLNPPLVSFLVDNRSSNLKLFKKNRYFSLNILSQEQLNLARAFATPKNNSKWNIEDYYFGKKGNPIFKNSLAFLECERFKVTKIGDHHLIVGRVIDFSKSDDNKKPLIYFKGGFN